MLKKPLSLGKETNTTKQQQQQKLQQMKASYYKCVLGILAFS